VYARRVTSQGSPHARFSRALKTGNLFLVKTAAKELPRVDLEDALAICILMELQDDDAYERAAVRWLGRFALEAPAATMADLRTGAEALDALPSPEGRQALAALCKRHGLNRAAQTLQASR